MQDLPINVLLNNSDSSSSDDEEIINFIVHLGRPRRGPRIQARRNHFQYWDNSDFHKRFRLSKECVTYILELIVDDIKHPTNWNNALSPMEMLLLTLRFLATGSYLIVVGDFLGIHKTTAGRIIFKVTQAIANLRPRFIKFPTTANELRNIQQQFYSIARFPRVVGALDCTHVKIKSPGGLNAEIYRNRKQFFSMNVQAICDPNLKLLNLVARWPGSVHDSTIFRNSHVCQQFENGEMGQGILLGDNGYPCKKYLITPLLATHTRAENLFNEAQIRTRNPVERLFGVWKRRFPILSSGINLTVAKVQWIIVATGVLHNICIENNEAEPPELTLAEQQQFNIVNNVLVERIGHGNFSTRHEIIQYFSNL